MSKSQIVTASAWFHFQPKLEFHSEKEKYLSNTSETIWKDKLLVESR